MQSGILITSSLWDFKMFTLGFLSQLRADGTYAKSRVATQLW